MKAGGSMSLRTPEADCTDAWVSLQSRLARLGGYWSECRIAQD